MVLGLHWERQIVNLQLIVPYIICYMDSHFPNNAGKKEDEFQRFQIKFDGPFHQWILFDEKEVADKKSYLHQKNHAYNIETFKSFLAGPQEIWDAI